MKKLYAFILLSALLSGSRAQAGLIFLDDYEGMSINAPLTDIFRTPTLGPANSASWFSAAGSASAQVIGVPGGMAAGVCVPIGGAFDYLADLKQEYGGGRFLVEWNIVVYAVGQDPGLFAVRFPTPNDSMQILFGFLNDGRMIRFNAAPSPDSIVQVGTFSAATDYAVALTYDLATDRYWVTLNGVNVIADEPIPTYLDTGFIDRFGFDINQTDQIQLNDLFPQGNAYVVDNVRFSQIETLPEPGTMLLVAGGIAMMAAWRKINREVPLCRKRG